MAEYPYATIAASISCPQLRQSFVNAARTRTRVPPYELLRIVERNRWAFDR